MTYYSVSFPFYFAFLYFINYFFCLVSSFPFFRWLRYLRQKDAIDVDLETGYYYENKTKRKKLLINIFIIHHRRLLFGLILDTLNSCFDGTLITDIISRNSLNSLRGRNRVHIFIKFIH